MIDDLALASRFCIIEDFVVASTQGDTSEMVIKAIPATIPGLDTCHMHCSKIGAFMLSQPVYMLWFTTRPAIYCHFDNSEYIVSTPFRWFELQTV